MAKQYLDRPVFDSSRITGDLAEQLVITHTDETAHYSHAFSYNELFLETLGIIGLYVELDGNAADTMAVTVQFWYGGNTTWGTKYIALAAAQACNTTQYYRLDIQTTFRDCIPFNKLRFKFQKTGDTADCTVRSRITRL